MTHTRDFEVKLQSSRVEVLDLADKYPRDSLTAHILDCVAQFLPVFLCPCTRRGRVRQIISSAKRFQRGDWKGLWETPLRLARKEIDTNNKRKHNRAKRDYVIYADSSSIRGALRGREFFLRLIKL
jgi:hypothetical protein